MDNMTKATMAVAMLVVITAAVVVIVSGCGPGQLNLVGTTYHTTTTFQGSTFDTYIVFGTNTVTYTKHPGNSEANTNISYPYHVSGRTVYITPPASSGMNADTLKASDDGKTLTNVKNGTQWEKQ